MSRRDKYVDCPVCREESKLTEQRCFTGDQISFADGATLDDLFTVIRRGGRPDHRSSREFIHWACNSCLEKGRALLAKPREQQFYSCWPYYTYFSVRFWCPHCEASFTFDKRDQFTRFEVEKQWVQAWPQYCRSCKSKFFRQLLRYEPVF
jgi:hypothetical protein